MTPGEWAIVAAFIGAVYGLSFVSPEAAMMLAGFVAIRAFVDSGLVTKFAPKGTQN
jgi:hypothetical protein